MSKYEHDRAIMEAEAIDASDNYFAARPHLNSIGGNILFMAGFVSAWEMYKNRIAATQANTAKG